jgi:hypothetical protein
MSAGETSVQPLTRQVKNTMSLSSGRYRVTSRHPWLAKKPTQPSTTDLRLLATNCYITCRAWLVWHPRFAYRAEYLSCEIFLPPLITILPHSLIHPLPTATMRVTLQTTTATALCLASAAHVSAHTRLEHWPKEAAASLEKMIVANANASNYACFDMDVCHSASAQSNNVPIKTKP